jgi:hypothetical protein
MKSVMSSGRSGPATSHAKRKRRRVVRTTESEFPQALVEWVDKDAALLRALVALRRLGDEGVDAVEEVLAVPRVAVLRWSWNLWAALVEGSGGDAEDLLLEVLPLHVLEQARWALWGEEWSSDAGLALPA